MMSMSQSGRTRSVAVLRPNADIHAIGGLLGNPFLTDNTGTGNELEGDISKNTASTVVVEDGVAGNSAEVTQFHNDPCRARDSEGARCGFPRAGSAGCHGRLARPARARFPVRAPTRTRGRTRWQRQSHRPVCLLWLWGGQKTGIGESEHRGNGE